MVINFSVSAFLLPAFSTISNILDIVDSPKFFVTFTLITEFKFILPDKISLFTETSRGIDSPVKADVSTEPAPSIIIPSKGTLSPGLIIITSSILTASGLTLVSPFSVIKLAYSALTFISAVIDLLEVFTA